MVAMRSVFLVRNSPAARNERDPKMRNDPRRIGVSAVLLPERRAFGRLRLPIAYREQVLDLARSADLPVLDLSGLLSEAEFADMNHSNEAGLRKTHRQLMDLAARRLAEISSPADRSRTDGSKSGG